VTNAAGQAARGWGRSLRRKRRWLSKHFSNMAMSSAKVYPLTVDLWSTSIVLSKGHRVRIAVSSSNAPRFQPNPNTGRPPGDGAKPRIATNTLHLSERVLKLLAGFQRVPLLVLASKGCHCWLVQQCFSGEIHFALLGKPAVAPISKHVLRRISLPRHPAHLRSDAIDPAPGGLLTEAPTTVFAWRSARCLARSKWSGSNQLPGASSKWR